MTPWVKVLDRSIMEIKDDRIGLEIDYLYLSPSNITKNYRVIIRLISETVIPDDSRLSWKKSPWTLIGKSRKTHPNNFPKFEFSGPWAWPIPGKPIHAGLEKSSMRIPTWKTNPCQPGKLIYTNSNLENPSMPTWKTLPCEFHKYLISFNIGLW